MKDKICHAIRDFAANDKGGFFENGGRYFDEPLIGFAAADDPLFLRYKQVVGVFHLAPEEIVSGDPEPWTPKTVISWILPISSAARHSNRSQDRLPSRQWAQTRAHGELFNVALRRHLVDFLSSAGFRAFAPQLHESWKEFAESPAGRASSWSERHAAYAAGLGTFSLNDGLITARGIAHRCGSVITDAAIAPSPRTSSDHRSNCLFYRYGSCGACIARCPVGAISKEGHDKSLCGDYVYRAVPEECAEAYGVRQTGCGLCQTKVPCEAGVPPERNDKP